MNQPKFKATWCSWAVNRGGAKSWVPRVDGRPKPGDLVEVVRKDGETETVKVVKILWSGQSKYDDTVQSIVSYTDPNNALPTGGPVQNNLDTWSETVRLPNGAVLTINYQAPLKEGPSASSTEGPPAGDLEVDGGVPF